GGERSHRADHRAGPWCARADADRGRPNCAPDLRGAHVPNPHGDRAVVQAGETAEVEVRSSSRCGCCDRNWHARGYCGHSYTHADYRTTGRRRYTARNAAAVMSDPTTVPAVDHAKEAAD